MDEQQKQSGEDTLPSTEGTLTPSELADELEYAPLANLRGCAESTEAKALVSHLAEVYPRKPGTSEKTYAPRLNTKVGHENAIGAFLGELLSACGDERRGGWLRCSLNKE